MKRMPRLSACVLVLALIHGPANADDIDDTQGGTTDDGIFVGAVKDQEDTDEHDPKPPVVVESAGPEILLGDAACDGADQAGDSVAVTFCPPNTPDQRVLTISIVRTAFARLNLPAANLVIQPPDGLTLVNFDTNFYTTSTAPISRTVTLLGQRVTLEATPAEFHWTFGDGESIATTEPGAPYPDLTVTHNYLRKGTYQPSLDTVFTGRFRVGGGPWRQIPGTVTINGTGQALRAIEAQPKLVGY